MLRGLSKFNNTDEIIGYDDYKLVAIPTNITAITIKKMLNKLVDDMELKPIVKVHLLKHYYSIEIL